MNEFVLVYDVVRDVESIRMMQEASIGPGELGLAPDPLVFSEEWWAQIQSGQREVRSIEGNIDEVYWGSMRDWPEFRIVADDGTSATWTREGDIRRYVEGLRVRITYTEHPYKPSAAIPTPEMSQIVLEIAVEDGIRRSSGIAPGPEGVGYEIARRRGEAVHYIRVSSEETASRLTADMEKEGLGARVVELVTSGYWIVSVWHADESAAERWRKDLVNRCKDYGARYDGGEVVGGVVWDAN